MLCFHIPVEKVEVIFKLFLLYGWVTYQMSDVVTDGFFTPTCRVSPGYDSKITKEAIGRTSN